MDPRKSYTTTRLVGFDQVRCARISQEKPECPDHNWGPGSDPRRHDVGWDSTSGRQANETEQGSVGTCERSLSKTRKQAQAYEVSDQDGHSSTGFRSPAETSWHSSRSKDATVKHNPVLPTGGALRNEGHIPRQHHSLLRIIQNDATEGSRNQDYRDHRVGARTNS